MNSAPDRNLIRNDDDPELSYREAIAAAITDEMVADPSVLLLGEDVDAGGPFKTVDGLLDRFGPTRVLNMPICENGFTGVALGMSLMGLRPVVEIMFSDFLPTAADALMVELPKFRFMSGGRCSVPVTVRAIGGATGRFGAQHSSTGESWFIQAVGMRIAAASSPNAAYELLRTSIRDNNPTLVIEHKALLSQRGPVARVQPELGTIGVAKVVRPGSHVTIVSSLLMVHRALEAAVQLSQEGIEAEVVDIRWIVPFDLDTVAESVSKTSHLLVVEEQPHEGSWSASMISRLLITGRLERVRVGNVSMPETPIPFSAPLEDHVVPTVARIVDAVRSLVHSSVGASAAHGGVQVL